MLPSQFRIANLSIVLMLLGLVGFISPCYADKDLYTFSRLLSPVVAWDETVFVKEITIDRREYLGVVNDKSRGEILDVADGYKTVACFSHPTRGLGTWHNLFFLQNLSGKPLLIGAPKKPITEKLIAYHFEIPDKDSFNEAIHLQEAVLNMDERLEALKYYLESDQEEVQTPFGAVTGVDAVDESSDFDFNSIPKEARLKLAGRFRIAEKGTNQSFNYNSSHKTSGGILYLGHGVAVSVWTLSRSTSKED